MFLETRNLVLKPFLKENISMKYLKWLNDPEINKYSLRRFHPYSDFDANRYLDNLADNEKILSINTKDNEYIGNIKYGPIDWLNRSADVSIIIGEKDFWGKGFASESIYLITKHLFLTLNLNRVGADSCNPAFIQAVKKNLGWRLEGKMEKRMFVENEYVDYYFLAILQKDFKIISKYEKC